MEAARLSCDARAQVNLTATPLTQDGSVSDISRVCTIFQRAAGRGGVGGKATHPPLSMYIRLRKLFFFLARRVITVTNTRAD